MLGGLFGDDWNDPRSMAALQLGAGLMAAGGPSRNPVNLGMAMLGGLNQYQGVMDSAAKRKLLEEEMGLRREDTTMRREEFNAKLAEAQRKRQEQEATKAEFAEWVKTLPPEMQRLAAISPETVIARMFPKDRQPLVTKPGDVIRDPVDPTRVLAQNAPEPEKDPEFVRALRLAGIQEGSPEWKRAMFNYVATKSTHAPAASQNVYTGQMVPAEVGGKSAFVMPSKDGGYTVLPGITPPGAADKEAKEGARAQGAVQQANIVIGKVDDALKKVGFFSTGLTGAAVAKIPGTPAYDLRGDIDTIKANIGFQTLQAMREASPTGGALGNTAIQELNMLQSTIASLDPNQSEPQIRQSLMAVRRHYSNWKNAVQQAARGGGMPTGGASGDFNDDPLGIRRK